MTRHAEVKRAIVKVIASFDGVIHSDTLLSLFEGMIKKNGIIIRPAYIEFHKLLMDVAVRHESPVFGRRWILRKPRRRLS